MSWAKDVWPSERARLMSAHMMPIEREAAQATVEILELNSWLDDELKCESQHRDFRNRECSVTVTHIAKGCEVPSLACTRQAEWVNSWSSSEIPCGDCGAPCATHWRAVPI